MSDQDKRLMDLYERIGELETVALTPNEAWKAWRALNMVGPDGTKFGLQCWEGAMKKLEQMAGGMHPAARAHGEPSDWYTG